MLSVDVPILERTNTVLIEIPYGFQEEIHFNITDKSLSESTAILYIEQPTGLPVTVPCSVNGNKVYYAPNPHDFFPGNNICQIRIGESLSMNIVVRCHRGSYIPTIEIANNDFSQKLLNQIETLSKKFDNAVSAVTSDTEVIDIRVGFDENIYKTAGESVREQAKYIYKKIQDLDSSVYDENDVGVSVSKIEDTNYISSAPTANISPNGLTGIKLSENQNFDTYYKIMDYNTEIYFEITESVYVSICVGENYSGEDYDIAGNKYLLSENPVRYRKSEGNLPSKTNKLYVKKGDVIAITVTKGGNDIVYGFKTEKVIKNSFAEEIASKANIDFKKCSLFYGNVDTGMGSSVKEQLSIFLPATFGFLKYAFIRNESNDTNSNNWRIYRAYSCDDNKTIRFPITAEGEWEMALKINERPDFIGGYAHGDEVLKDILFFIDGEKVNINEISEMKNFEELRIVETTDLYDPNDKATLETNADFIPVAHHGKEYIFTKTGLRLKQFVVFDFAQTMGSSYMTMLPIIRGKDLQWPSQITDSYYSDDLYDISDVSTMETGADAYNWRPNCKRAVIWSNISGVSAEVEILNQKESGLISEKYHKVQSSETYNKLYWTVCCIGDQTAEIQKNHRFETDAFFKLNVNK